MKIKLIIALVFLTITSFVSNAQEIGIRGGLNFSTMKGLQDVDATTHMGIQLGGTAIFTLNDNIKINTSILYTEKGISYKYYNYVSQELVKSKTTFSYLELPVAIEYSIDAGNIKPYYQAGVYLAYTISGKRKFKDDDEKYVEDLVIGENEGDFISPLDLGFTFGTGIDINKFRIGVNYDLGLHNLLPQDELNELIDEEPYSILNRSLSINVTYFLNR